MMAEPSPDCSGTTMLNMLAEELKTLRLPHKLKQYRHYCKRIEQLRSKIIVDDEQMYQTIRQQEIDQLYAILDKSVICGVDQCFLCNCNTNFNDNHSDAAYGGGKSQWLDSTQKVIKQQQQHQQQPQMPTLEEQNQFDGSIVNKIGIQAEAEINCKNNGNPLKSSLESNSDSDSSTTGIEENAVNTTTINDQPVSHGGFANGDSSKSTTNDDDHESEQGEEDHQDNNSSFPREHKENNIELSNGKGSVQVPSAFVKPLMINNNNNNNNDDSNGNNLWHNNGGNKTSLCSPTTTTIMSPRPYQKGSFLTTSVGRSVPFTINNNNNNSYKAYKDFINNYAQAQTVSSNKN